MKFFNIYFFELRVLNHVPGIKHPNQVLFSCLKKGRSLRGPKNKTRNIQKDFELSKPVLGGLHQAHSFPIFSLPGSHSFGRICPRFHSEAHSNSALLTSVTFSDHPCYYSNPIALFLHGVYVEWSVSCL